MIITPNELSHHIDTSHFHVAYEERPAPGLSLKNFDLQVKAERYAMLVSVFLFFACVFGMVSGYLSVFSGILSVSFIVCISLTSFFAVIMCINCFIFFGYIHELP